MIICDCPSSLLQLCFVFCSEADKVPVEDLTFKDKEKSNERENEKEKTPGEGSSLTATSPTTQPAAVTQ